jgi:hypothetical protein
VVLFRWCFSHRLKPYALRLKHWFIVFSALLNNTAFLREPGVKKWCMSEQAVSRVLFARAVTRSGTMTIHLASLLPPRSSDLPGNSGGPPSNVSLFGLAPGGVCQAPAVTDGTGELLPHLFTLTPGLARERFVFCGTFLPVARTGRYPAPCPVEPGLSSPPHSVCGIRATDFFVLCLSPQTECRAAVICPAPTYAFILPHFPSSENARPLPSR